MPDPVAPCPSCGAQTAGARFCENCGAKLTNQRAPQGAPPRPKRTKLWIGLSAGAVVVIAAIVVGVVFVA